jgi:hypothetical protein
MTHGGNRNSYRVLLGKHEGKRPLGRPRDQWEDNIKVDIKVLGVDYIYLVQDRDSEWVCFEHRNESSGSIRCREFLDYPRNCQLYMKDSASWSISC